MNYIGIDPSIVSTGVVINGKVFNYCRRSEVFKEKAVDSYTKWFDLCKDVITYRYIDLTYVDGYSENEIQKMRMYDAISDMIMDDINKNIKIDEPIQIAIEGYSYSSSAGDIIDLVTFSTLLRRKLLTLSTDITILSPASLKLESCKLTYVPIEKHIGGKKPRIEYIYRNTLGVAGGSFTKIDMFGALVDNANFNDEYCTFLKENKMSILFTKNIKKPLEDCNDAYLLYLFLKQRNNI
jgi:hypothetical protein